MFKKNKVWVATDAQGSPLIHKSKALIKYQLDQDYEYWVNPDKLQEISPKTHSEHKDVITIYTDGASSGNPGPSGIGVVMQYGGHEREISRFIGHTTNNAAELTAVYTALRALKRKDLPVRVYTDSSYVYNLLASGWKAKKNVDLVNSIKKLMSTFPDIRIIKVRGHEGVPGNERADGLATSAIRKTRSTKNPRG